MSQHTKHINVLVRFLTALILQIMIVRHFFSENSYADLFTKNLSISVQEHFIYHIHNGTVEIPLVTAELSGDREDDKRSGPSSKLGAAPKGIALTSTSLTARPMSGLMSEPDIIDEAYKLMGLDLSSSNFCYAFFSVMKAADSSQFFRIPKNKKSKHFLYPQNGQHCRKIRKMRRLLCAAMA